MNGPQFPTIHTVIDLTELVRGQEQQFLEQLRPLVSEQSVALDLRKVARIDAAGLSALIALYCDACKAGRNFTVSHPGPHVREILEIVGLDRILIPACEAGPSFDDAQLEETAA